MKTHKKQNDIGLIAGLGVKYGTKYKGVIQNEQETRSHTKRSLFFGVPWYRTVDLENVTVESDNKEQT